MARQRRAVIDRLADLIDIADTGCWLWTGSIQGGKGAGYGRINIEKQRKLAHRVSYETLVEPIPTGLQLDHLCRVRNCVNPDHLEPVTPRENTRRSPIHISVVMAAKTHCPQNHEYTPENTYRFATAWGGTQRACKACRHERYASNGGKSS